MSDQLFSLFRSNVGDLDPLTQRNLFLAFRELAFQSVYFILNDRSLTEDAIQEAFIKAMVNGPRTRPDSNMKSWLKQVARNAAFDIIRKNKKYRQVSDLDSVMIYEENEQLRDFPESTDEIVENMLRNESLVETLNELKVEYRIVLVLRYLEEMSYKEIAEELGITDQVLSKRLERARKKLADLFTQKWGVRDEA
ncbi:RNA polymerase sigma factor [Brevibacillus sp. B_LB10_24]|uniref:RNA polymerase sigma factor n=1 Tax=Brevibacillus sp. B_LB10_24 TaxID=3380645 RepID=UPI0038BCA3D8